MKKIYIPALILIISGAQLWAQSVQADSLFQEANKAYGLEKFDEAIEIYESVVDLGVEAPELYFNLGNAYYKIRNYPRAMLNYERALLLDPNNERLKYNMDKTRVYNVDKVESIPEFVLKRWMNSVYNLFSPNIWALISMALFAFAMTFLLLYFLSMTMKIKRLGFYTGVILLFIALTTFWVASKAKSIREDSRAGILMTPSVTVKGSPSAAGVDLFIIHEGTKVYVLDELNNWYEVRLSDGKQGWLQAIDVELI